MSIFCTIRNASDEMSFNLQLATACATYADDDDDDDDEEDEEDDMAGGVAQSGQCGDRSAPATLSQKCDKHL
jgi:hypothetical protein